MQSKYFGSLRYWLYSIPMSALLRKEVKSDADVLWWSKEPDLRLPKKRIRRFVAKNTAIGPRNKGGLNNMDWDGHTTAVLAGWVFRWIQPPDRDVCAWKHVLYHMVMVDKRGLDKFPEGRSIMFSRMTPADKVRMMRGVPKRAEYIKSCFRAFWKLGIKQDLTKTEYLRSEPFWHSARFRLNSTPVERNYYSSVLGVTMLGDVINMSTNSPRTVENWAQWIKEKQTEFDDGKEPEDAFVQRNATRMHDLASQVPDALITLLQSQASQIHAPKDGETVMLVVPGVQEQEEGVYAEYRGGSFKEQWIDAYGIAHHTGRGANAQGMRVLAVELWNTRSGKRVRGPFDAVFPHTDGWLLDGQKVKLDSMSTSKMTRALALRKFITPASEAVWDKKRGSPLRWKEAWKIRSFFATPRDQVTWLKLQHRTLYTVKHRTDMDTSCRACTEVENQEHLMNCSVIVHEFWGPIIELLMQAGMDRPEDTTNFLITGQLSGAATAHQDFLGMVFLAWRCLYAEIQRSRDEDTPLDLQNAYARTVHMGVSRLAAYGEKWRSWVITGADRRHPNCIPPKYFDRRWLTMDVHGDYEIDPGLLAEKANTRVAKQVQDMGRKAGGPQNVGAQDDARGAADDDGQAGAQQDAEDAAGGDGEPAARRDGVSAAGGSTDMAEEGVREEEDDTGMAEADVHRDMSGDALTYAQACARGVHAQCPLSAVRNLRRNPDYTHSRLAEHSVGPEYIGDIRVVDWPVLMNPLLTEGEVVKRTGVANISEAHFHDVRAGVILIQYAASGHVVAVHRDEGVGYRLYDNDSSARAHGTYEAVRADELLDRYHTGILYGVMEESSELSRHIGGDAITTIVRRARRERAEREERRVRQRTTRGATRANPWVV